ncbi:MAG TPA: TRAP transporter substrate-binding protein [Thermohalobaculum sp.]|nr:TRAP transporter substrate-binding protein [Thermohalobaculum sp.]
MHRIIALATGLTLAAGAAQAAEKWDMPMAYAESNYHTQTGKAFARCVGIATGGEIEITVHASGSLFKGDEIKRAVQTGQAPVGERLLSAHQNENPIFGIDSVPLLATTFEDSEKLWSAAKPTVEEILAEQNLELLYTVPWPPQGLYFKQEVSSVADMQGIKFRSYNSATARLAELTGMQPVQVEAAELTQAFATGVAGSMISSAATGYDRKVWEHLTHFYTADAWMPRNAVMANKDAWEALPDASRNAVRGCADLAAYAGYWRAVQYTDFTLNALAENGMSVQAPGEQLQADLAEIGRQMAEEWAADAGEKGQAIIEAFRAMK